VPKRTPAPEEVLARVRAAGGVAVIAHPLLYGLADPEAFFADWDIAGIEVDHPAHPARARADLAGWIARRGLIATAGSDWHGEEEPDAYIGCRRCDLSVARALLAAGAGGGRGPSRRPG
jgi:predicted metal-dependent phosphoesterase TrpH